MELEENINIIIDFDLEKQNVFIGEESGANAIYKCKTKEDFKNMIIKYIDLYL